MPISSYVLQAQPEKSQNILTILNTMDHVDVTPSENMDVFVVVVDTPDIDTDTMVERALKDIDGVINVAFAYGDVEGDIEHSNEGYKNV